MAKVQYIGASDVRQITKSDWRSIDIDHDTVTWTKASPDHLPVVDFGEGDLPEDLHMYFEEDTEFKVYADDAKIPRTGRAAKRREAADGQEPGANTGGLGGGTTTAASGTGGRGGRAGRGGTTT